MRSARQGGERRAEAVRTAAQARNAFDQGSRAPQARPSGALRACGGGHCASLDRLRLPAPRAAQSKGNSSPGAFAAQSAIERDHAWTNTAADLAALSRPRGFLHRVTSGMWGPGRWSVMRDAGSASAGSQSSSPQARRYIAPWVARAPRHCAGLRTPNRSGNARRRPHIRGWPTAPPGDQESTRDTGNMLTCRGRKRGHCTDRSNRMRSARRARCPPARSRGP